jgi:tRNA1(Val) A37 N6-methylase TrmN6
VARKSRKEDETLDTFYSGRILVLQKKRGYRFSVDAPLLADFIRTNPQDELLELGTGSGIISLLLSIKDFKHITAVEIQRSLAQIARRNVSLNNLEKRIAVIEQDLRSYRPQKKFDVIFSNPPYIKKNIGHLSPSVEKSTAKHELSCTITDILKKTHELLKREGRAYFIYPARRRNNFFGGVDTSGLSTKKVRYVFSQPEKPATFLLAECGFSPGGTVELPPFILYTKSGSYSAEAQEVFTGRVEMD